MADSRLGETDELAFTDMDLARANLIRDLRDNMGVNHEGLGVILHLLDQMHALRRALASALDSARDRRPSSEQYATFAPAAERLEAYQAAAAAWPMSSALRLRQLDIAIERP